MRIVLQQARCIEAGLVVPKKFTLRSIWTRFLFDDFVKSSQRIFPVSELFQANALLKERLVTPMRRSVFLASKLIINASRAVIVFMVGLAGFVENIPLPAECFPLLFGFSVPLQYLIIKRRGVLGFAQFALDHSLFVPRRPF